MEIFNERLKTARKRKNMSRAKLAEMLCVTPATVTRWENGDREPDFATTRRIADALETTISFLLGEIDKPAPFIIVPTYILPEDQFHTKVAVPSQDEALLDLFHTLESREREEAIQFIRFKKYLPSKKEERQ
ncbi:MAG: helix-turn-helix domain-containing protein [Synergistaceae bacterium]|nr:helix-turn-helix domain-containing protein [Synergistaceae bacterium]